MLNETCPRCKAPLNISTLAETLRECPKCRMEFQAQQAKAVALLTRTGEEQKPRPRALINLTPEFAAKYRLIRVVGAGAMGTVVEAADVRQGDRTVAVKFLMRLNSAPILERFVREVRALSSLSHPNILKMFDNGELDGHPYVITEFLSGGTLRDRLKKRPVLPLDQVVAICAPLLRALAACHAKGLVHRDVKPENVLFGDDGRPRLADLGLAKEEGGAELTEDGVALGTPLYMSPEQVSGEKVGPGSDIYSIALLIYEMLAGKHPFIAPRLANILDHHLRTMPKPIHEVVSGLPAELWTVMLPALAKRLDQRTSDAAGMADALEELLQRASEAQTRATLPAKPRTPPAEPPPAPKPVPTRTGPIPKAETKTPSRKEKPLAAPETSGATPAAPRGFVGLPLGVRALIAATPFVLLAFIALKPSDPPPPPPPSPSRSRPPFLVSTPPEVSSTPSASASPKAGGGGGGGGGASAAALADDEDMVHVPGGTFTMGAEGAFAGDSNAHEVRVRSFWIDRNEVTNARFAKFILATGYKTEAERRGHGLINDGKQLLEVEGADWRHPRGKDDNIEGKDDRPVVQVSWNDAYAFGVWAKKRLPTEAEWERMARGSARGLYPWGDESPPGRACVGRTPADGPSAVGGFSANDFGVKDVLGNVREWCNDWYGAGYYRTPAANEDPIGPDNGNTRVVRGGSFVSPLDEVALPVRRKDLPNGSANDLGFRCARDSSR